MAETSQAPSQYAIGTPGYAAALQIIRSFETGSPTGGFSRIADHPKDKGGLSYGWFQAADKPDTLDRIVEEYITRGGSLAAKLKSYVVILKQDQGSGNTALKALLEAAGSDPVMQAAQDTIFHQLYALPAYNYATKLGLVEPLSFAVVLDSYVQGVDWQKLRNRFPESPPSDGGRELVWLEQYLKVRLAWLESLDSLANQTGYRPKTFQKLLAEKNLKLTKPLTILFSKSQKVIP
jgi:chitosanase